MAIPTTKIIGIAALASSVVCGVAAFVMSRMALRAVEQQQEHYNVSYFIEPNRTESLSDSDNAVAKSDSPAA